ncbi:MAG: EAL domain-containing protein [Rhodocyclaceae bacterium]|nr:EAL domain-containing protein [Rhodocyclaceae bacterium]
MKRPALILTICWLAVGLASVWLAAGLVHKRDRLEQAATERVMALARLVAKHVGSMMDATDLILATSADELGGRLPGRGNQAAAADAHVILKTAASRTSAVDDLMLTGPDGTLLASSSETAVRGTMKGESYFELLRADPAADSMATTIRGRHSGRWGLLLARALRNGEGRLLGVLAAHVGLENTFLSFYRSLGLPDGASIAVWNRQGTLLLRHPFIESKIGAQADLPQLAPLLEGRVRETTLVEASPVDGESRNAAVRWVERHPLIVSVSERRDDYLAPWRADVWRTTLVVGLMLAACVGLHLMLRQRLQAEQRFGQLLDGAPIGVVCFDRDRHGVIRPFAANRHAQTLLPALAGGDHVLAALALPGVEPALQRLDGDERPWRATEVAVDTATGPRRLDLQLFPIGPGEAGLLITDASERHRHRHVHEREIARMAAALEDADFGVREWDVAGGRMHYSRRWLQQLGYEPGGVDDSLEAWESLVHPSDLGRCRQELERHVSGLSSTYRSEHRMRRRNGDFVWVRERGRLVARSDEGRPLRMVLSQTDITALRQLEDKLALWGRVFTEAPEGVLVTDADANIIDVNDAYCAATGYSRKELIGANPRILASGHQDGAFYREMWSQVLEQGIWQGELRNRRADGSLFVQQTRIVTIHDRDGHTAYYIGFTHDISELRDNQQRLAHLSRHDALTRLPNRLQLTELMSLAIAMAQRNNQLLAVCVLDIDHFKPINERFGAEEGDKLLIEVAERLESGLQPGDTLARMGGDEFVLLLAGIESPEHCDHRVGEFLARLRLPFERPAGVVRLTASVGATLYPFDGGDPDTLLRHADQALYSAKQGGRDACHLFDTEQDRRLSIHRRAVSEVRAALEKGQLRLHYQPKVRFSDGKVIGVEALLRWQHAERGLLMPADFISRINDEDLLVSIGEWCLETAIVQAAEWHAAGRSIPVSVNVTAGQILGAEFATKLEALLERHPGFPPHLLEVEILESAALADLPRVVKLMERCAQRGVSFALDDFGTGYASLTYLKHLPAATLKIDQSFVRDILDDPEHRAIVEGVLGLTRVFGRTAIAEGVESIEHGEALILLGATHGQGYAIAGALRADELPTWIGEWRNPPEWTRACWRYRNLSSESRAKG